MLWEVQISKMANSLATFPSLLPRIADDLWFTLEKRLDDDAALTKEEEQYTALCKKILDKGSDIPPIGTKKSKDKQERMEEEDDDLEDDDESNDDMEDETDDYESPATPDVESVEGEIEMDSSQI